MHPLPPTHTNNATANKINTKNTHTGGCLGGAHRAAHGLVGRQQLQQPDGGCVFFFWGGGVLFYLAIIYIYTYTYSIRVHVDRISTPQRLRRPQISKNRRRRPLPPAAAEEDTPLVSHHGMTRSGSSGAVCGIGACFLHTHQSID